MLERFSFGLCPLVPKWEVGSLVESSAETVCDVGSRIQHSPTAWDLTQVTGQSASSLPSARKGNTVFEEQGNAGHCSVANEDENACAHTEGACSACPYTAGSEICVLACCGIGFCLSAHVVQN